MLSLSIRYLPIAVAVTVLAACHSSGGGDPPTADSTAPSIPADVAAAATSPTSVSVTWSAASDSGGSGVKEYVLYRGSAAIATVTTTSYTDSGLAASTQYSYQVSARDNANNDSNRSVVVIVTTLAAPDTTPPSVPTGLTAAATGATAVNISWSAATDPGGSGVKDYIVYRGGVAVATVTTTSFADSGLTASTLYTYQTSARDNVLNESARSAALSVTTPAAADTTPPSAPATLTASAVSSTQINLSWGAATDNVAVTGYRVERCTGPGCSSFVQIATPGGTSFSDTGLTASTSYGYRVRAVDAASNLGAFSNISSATTQAPPDTTAPSAPGTLTTSAVSSTQIALSWGAATDNIAVTGYRVERCTGAACSTFAQIATPTGTTFSDTGLTASTSYSYRVRAIDAASNLGAFSNTGSATTQAAPDTTAPSAPGTLTTSAVSSTQIALSWGAATDNVAVTGYRVERCTGAACSSFAQTATPTGTTFSDTNLTASTSYSYRVRAIDAASNLGAFSNIGSATTQAPPDTTPPSAPGTLAASAVSGTQIDLSWGAATDNVGVTGYRVERCSGAGCTFAQYATPTGLSFSDTGLTDSTSYSYRVRATDAANNLGAFSNTASATTPDATPPSAPGTLTASAISPTQIGLSWGAATDNVAVTGYVVERCAGAGCSSFAQIATPTGLSFSDTGLTASTSYSYRVRAVDGVGNSGAFSNTGSTTTQASPDMTPPSAPGTLTASAVSASRIDLAWGAATDDVGVTGYRVERCTGAACTTFAQIAVPTGLSFSDTGLTPSTSYSYRVRAVDAAGNPGASSNTSSAATQASADTTPPSAPATLTANAVSASRIDLTWGAATDDVGVTGYRVERCTGAGCSSFAEIAAPTGTTFSDTGLTASTSYSYRVRAVDAASNLGAFSNISSTTTQAPPDTTSPSAPGTLTTSTVSSTQIDLSWGAATDNVGVTGYRVERCAGAACSSFAQIATPTGLSFSDTGLTASTSYSYRVRATDAASNFGAFSNTGSATTQAPPDTTPPSAPGTLTTSAVSSTQIDLSWGAATDDVAVTGYRVERCTGAACSTFAQIATPTGTTFSDTGLTASTSYSYRVRAIDAASNLGAFSNTGSATTQAPPDTTAPSAPGTLTASAASATQIDLSWGAATDNIAVTGYRVERCTGAACSSFAQIATPNGTSFSDTGLTASTSYSYRVRAIDGASNLGAFSNTGSATTQAPPDTTAPSVPGTLTTSVASATQIDLSWGAATDNVAVTGYRVERCTGAACTTFAQIGAPTGTTFSDTGLTASTSYSYRVRATDAASNLSAFSNTSSATTQTPSTWGLDTRPSNATCVAPPRTIGSSTITISEFFNNGLSETVAATQAPGDNSRWYMVERNGRIMTFTGTNKNPTVFLDLSNAVNTDGDQEAGVLGLAFHPDFANNNKLYVFYSGAPTSGSYTIQSRIAEFTATNRTTASAATERVLIRADKFYTNHNGGQLAFGPDGLLYASLGDGGLGDDPVGNGQSQLTLFGKIIRIDVNGTTGSTGYAIPPGNPNFGNATCPLVASGQNLSTTSRAPAACPELYAWGLRNPWRFSLDRGSTSPDLWVGDVGESAYEEINRVQLGGNYGWDVREGPICHEPSSGCASAGLINPIVAAPRSSGMFAIIGGFVYRGQAIPSLAGRYLFTDYFKGAIQTYDASATIGYTTVLNDSGATVSAFAEGNDGELYLVDYFGGRLLSINPGSSGNAPPVPSLLSQTGCVVPGSSQPASGLVPYTPNAPFWSDGANKERWMGLPNSTVASVAADGDWQLATGTVLMKNFRLGSGQLIETRLLMRHPDGEWAGYTYQWNGAETEATRVIGGGTVPVGTPSQNWIYPSESQCLQCHTSAAGRSLGLETSQLNGPVLYPQTGRTANQITTLAHIGILPSSMPDASTLPVLPAPQGSAPLGTRARAYLHTNCSFCHRPGGGVPGNLDLRYDTPIGATNICNATPTVSDLGVAGAKLVTPANPAASVLYLRMNRRGANQMPPIGSNLVDIDGAALLEQWILQMSGTCN